MSYNKGMVCKSCGAMISDEKEFCGVCGVSSTTADRLYNDKRANKSYCAPVVEEKYNVFTAFIKMLKKFACFTGTCARNEFWFGFLASILLIIAINIISGVVCDVIEIFSRDSRGALWVGGIESVISAIEWLLFLPVASMIVRRLHDVGLSGWLALIGLIPFFGTIALIVILCMETSKKPNAYNVEARGELQGNRKNMLSIGIIWVVIVLLFEAYGYIKVYAPYINHEMREEIYDEFRDDEDVFNGFGGGQSPQGEEFDLWDYFGSPKVQPMP